MFEGGDLHWTSGQQKTDLRVAAGEGGRGSVLRAEGGLIRPEGLGVLQRWEGVRVFRKPIFLDACGVVP